MKNTLIITGGILLILLGLFHLSFWHLFNWQEELPKLSPENNGIMQLSTVGFVCLLVSLGGIFIRYRTEIANTRLGKALLFTLSFFFFARTIGEFIFPGTTIELGIFLLFCMLLFLFPALMESKGNTNE